MIDRQVTNSLIIIEKSHNFERDYEDTRNWLLSNMLRTTTCHQQDETFVETEHTYRSALNRLEDANRNNQKSHRVTT